MEWKYTESPQHRMHRELRENATRKLLLNSTPLWSTVFFPHIASTVVPEFHKEIYDAYHRYKRVVVAAPRAFAKSSTAFFYITQQIVKAKRRDILYLSATGKLAEERLSIIKREFETNETLINGFGNMVGPTWRHDLLEFSNGVKLRAKGRGYQVRGFRPDLVVADDLEDDELVDSLDQSEKLRKWFWKALMPVLDGGRPQFIYIGNFLGPNCFLKEVLEMVERKELKYWHSRRYAATDNGLLPSQGGQSIWPSKWTNELLAEKELENLHAFMCEYMNEPLPYGETLFDREWIKYYQELPQPAKFYIVVDPAISDQQRADDTAIMVTATDTGNNLYAVEYQSEKMTPHESMDILFDYVVKYRTPRVGVEKAGFQKAYVYMLRDEMKKRGVFFPIDELPADKSKRRRAQPLVNRAQAGAMFIKPTHRKLEHQIISFTGKNQGYGVDDLVDCFSYAAQQAQEAAETRLSVDPVEAQPYSVKWWMDELIKRDRQWASQEY